FRRTPEDMARLYVRGRDNEMVPVSSLVRTEYRSGPTQLLRFNGFGSALFTGTPKTGRSSGEVMKEIDQLVPEQVEARGGGARVLGAVIPGAPCHGTGRTGLRVGPHHRIPGARRPVRELVHPVRGT